MTFEEAIKEITHPAHHLIETNWIARELCEEIWKLAFAAGYSEAEKRLKKPETRLMDILDL